MSILGVRKISSTRLFPDISSSPRQVPLSILDATVARFAPTSAVWIYDRPVDEHPSHVQEALSTDQLTLTLQKTLNAYPQWAGQLQIVPYDAHGDHTQRFGRLILSYGTASDPGVELVVAHCPRHLSSLVPSAPERAAGSQYWDVGQFPSMELLPTTPLLALHDMVEFTGLPGMIVQLTTFDCGGVAIAIQMAHPLADAQAMLKMAHDWAATNRALLAHTPLPSLAPVFDPGMLDRAAAGDIDAPKSNSTLIEIARGLPINRYDWWASAENCPETFIPATQIPSIFDPGVIEPLGDPLPWSEWDLMAPVDHYLIYFSPDEVRRMWEEASSGTGSGSSPNRVSRLDALLAHVWSLIIRSQDLEHEDETVNLNVTLGIRGRLSPALPDAFIGTPITLARVTGQRSMSIGTMAASIRATLSKFTPSAVSALLHDKAHEVCPQRMWATFLGRRNYIVTSWLRLGIYDLDFGGGTPRYVEAVMPSCDGCVQVMEAGGSSSDRKCWYDNGVNVSLHLKSDVMQRLLKDPLLRKYTYPTK